MNSRNLLILSLSILLVGCSNKKDTTKTNEPIPTSQLSSNATNQVSNKEAKPEPRPAIEATKSDSIEKSKVKTDIHLHDLRNEVYMTLDSKVFNNNFETKIQKLWPLLQKMQKKDLIDKILQTKSLSKSYMGRKPYSLVNTLIKFDLDKEFTLYILDSLKHNQQPNILVAKDYLRVRFNKNLGSNYYEWKQVILNFY